MISTIRDFEDQMEAVRRASGVPASAAAEQWAKAFGIVTPPKPSDSIEEWQRRCARSQALADARRRDISPHPWPERGHVIATVAGALLLGAVAWLFLVASAADFS